MPLEHIRIINEHLRLGTLDLERFAAKHTLTLKREIEKQGTIFLLKKLFGDEVPELVYTAAGKPCLRGSSQHISLTHSHDKLAIIVNEKEETGVDVELVREKVKNIQHKFLNPNELVFANNDPERLTVLWAAKEAVYKAYGLREVEFINNILVEPYDDNTEVFYASLQKNEIKRRYLLKREKHDNYILVYILHEVR